MWSDIRTIKQSANKIIIESVLQQKWSWGEAEGLDKASSITQKALRPLCIWLTRLLKKSKAEWAFQIQEQFWCDLWIYTHTHHWSARMRKVITWQTLHCLVLLSLETVHPLSTTCFTAITCMGTSPDTYLIRCNNFIQNSVVYNCTKQEENWPAPIIFAATQTALRNASNLMNMQKSFKLRLQCFKEGLRLTTSAPAV